MEETGTPIKKVLQKQAQTIPEVKQDRKDSKLSDSTNHAFFVDLKEKGTQTPGNGHIDGCCWIASTGKKNEMQDNGDIWVLKIDIIKYIHNYH